MAKGWGKSPLAAFIAVEEFVGPVVFDGWDADGEPVGRPWGTGDAPPPWVQIAAVSEDQTDNTYGAIYEMLVANDHKAAINLGIDDGRTRMYLNGKPGRLEPVTASAGSREGQRVTFSIFDETHLWKPSNGGLKLAGTIRRNAAKMGGRTFETTNAPLLGEKSVAERSGSDVERGFSGILHYAKRPPAEPQPNWTDADLLAALELVYGDAYWIDKPRLIKDIRDPSTDWEDALRYFFNTRTAGAGKAVDPRVWDALVESMEIPAGTVIGLGFDGSISEDATFLRGCTRDGYSFLIGGWVRPVGEQMERWRQEHPNREWKIPRKEVHEAVDAAFSRYLVGRMYCDPPKWWTEIEGWAEKYGEEMVVSFDTNQTRRMGSAVDRWLTAIREGVHHHDGDPVTSDHVKAAHLKKVRDADQEDDGRTKYAVVKGEDRRKIDAAIADILAYEAAMTMPEPPQRKPSRYNDPNVRLTVA